MREYFYLFVPALSASLGIGGGIVLTRSPEARRHALVWFFSAVCVLAALPVTFCASGNYSAPLRIMVAGGSGAAIGMILYGILRAMR
jgi:hypothetical protein